MRGARNPGVVMELVPLALLGLAAWTWFRATTGPAPAPAGVPMSRPSGFVAVTDPAPPRSVSAGAPAPLVSGMDLTAWAPMDRYLLGSAYYTQAP